MYDQIRDDVFYIMSYAAVAVMALVACCYLLLRRGNAFAADITPPLRLRRWTAAFFASIVLNHAWYMPIFFLDSSSDVMMTDLVGGLLDSVTFFPLAIIVPLTMLQDRRRPLWPLALLLAPVVVVGVVCVITRSYDPLSWVYVYLLLAAMALIIYMVRALRQYSQWLRDNYADLEHKELWQSFLVLGIMFLVFGTYAFVGKGPVYQFAMQAVVFILIWYLLWRVETLSDLSIHLCTSDTDTRDTLSTTKAGECESPSVERESAEADCLPSSPLPVPTHEYIGQLLQQHCIDTRLYLQHDLTITQLAKSIGTNRLYLSQYFSGQGITYNAYINNLRIAHFIDLYHEAVATNSPFTAQQLACESGYRSYSTFGIAFKQRMGQTVTAWMHDRDEKSVNLSS